MASNKRKPSKGKRKFGGLLLALVAFGCVIGTVVAYRNAVALRNSGIRTVAEVIEVQGGRGGYVVVRFKDAAGTDVVAEMGNYRRSPKPKVGDRQEILYDPKNPADNTADVRNGPDFLAAWLFGVGGLLAGALSVPTWTGRLDWDKL
ncbi:DUF3592 domain-containing protein [Kribbella deserti]|uniref:DUF3592 domain-containing protein n=1 Tax=Kribbella deserti TaxID=1926257 RepID=A0ABV6QU82_9ACTN